jgi:hypothetical protein
MRHAVTLALLAAGLARATGDLSAQSVTPAGEGALAGGSAEPARVQVSPDLVAELREGKTALRRIGWGRGAAELEEGAGAAFSDALAKLALALREAGGSYRADFYVEPQTDQAAAERIGAARFAAVRDGLDHAGLPDGVVVAGRVKVERDARLELVRIKP